MAFTPSGEQLVTSWETSATIRVWDVVTGREVRTIGNGEEWVRAFALSADGARLIRLVSNAKPAGQVSDGHARLQVWDFESGEMTSEIPFRTATLVAAALTADGNILVTGTANGIIHVLDIVSGKERDMLLGHQHTVSSLAFSSDGSLLASGSMDQTIRIWDTNEWTLRRVLTGHNRAVTAVAFLPETHLLVSGSGSRRYPLSPANPHMIRVWDSDSGEQIGAFSGHHTNTSTLAFAPTERRFVTGHENSTLLVWDIGRFGRQ